MVLKTAVDPNFNLKSMLLYIFLMLSATASMTLVGYIYWNPKNHLSILDKRNWFIAFAVNVPPIACLVLMSWAFLTLQSCKADEHSVSKKQIYL